MLGLKFRLGKVNTNNENDIIEIHSQNYIRDEDSRFHCVLQSETTSLWDVTGDNEPYIYEISAILADGNEKTVMQANFTIWKQIKEV